MLVVPEVQRSWLQLLHQSCGLLLSERALSSLIPDKSEKPLSARTVKNGFVTRLISDGLVGASDTLANNAVRIGGSGFGKPAGPFELAKSVWAGGITIKPIGSKLVDQPLHLGEGGSAGLAGLFTEPCKETLPLRPLKRRALELVQLLDRVGKTFAELAQHVLSTGALRGPLRPKQRSPLVSPSPFLGSVAPVLGETVSETFVTAGGSGTSVRLLTASRPPEGKPLWLGTGVHLQAVFVAGVPEHTGRVSGGLLTREA